MKEMVGNNLFILLGIFLFLGSCSKKLAESRLSEPSINFFQATLQKDIDSMQTKENDSKEYIMEFKEDATFRFERKMSMWNYVLDSIGYDINDLIIIDKSASGLTGVYQESFFFFDNKCIEAYLPPPTSNKIDIDPRIKIIEYTQLKEFNRDIFALYNTINSKEKLSIKNREPFRDNFGEYFITKFKNNIVSYYRTTSYDIGNSIPIKKLK